MSDKLDAIEMRIAFQEQTIETLNQVVAKQQTQIDQLIKVLQTMRSLLNDIRDSSATKYEDEKPPHY